MIEPQRESGVYALMIQLSILNNELLPFEIVDYDTHEGIDVIAKSDKRTPIYQSKLYYVEFKNKLGGSFNHCFDNLFTIVCWETMVKNGDMVSDLNNKKRKMQIIQPDENSTYTKIFLEDPQHPHRIEVFVLKQYLKEVLGLEFTPRPSTE